MALSEEDDLKGFKNWLKANLSLNHMKRGLEKFAEIRSKIFHEKVANDLAQNEGHDFITKCCNLCSTETFTKDKQTFRDKKWRNIKCPNNICHLWLDVALKSHKFKAPNIHWENTNPQLWPKESWELVKIFQPQGCEKQKSASEADCSAILALMHNCTDLRNCLENDLMIKEVQDVRNKIAHSSNLSVTDEEMNLYIKNMLDLLREVIKSGNISPEEVASAEEMYNKIDELQKREIDFDLVKQSEEAARKENVIELDSVFKLSKRLDEGDTRMTNLEKSFKDLKHQLLRMESDQSSCVSISVRTNSSAITPDTSIKKPPENVLRLQRHLREFYRHSQQIPLFSLSTASGTVHVDQLYVKPVMKVVNPDGRPNKKFTKVLKEDTDTLEDIFTSDGSLVKNVYICGDAGVGKTIFCEHLVSTWCHALEDVENGLQLSDDEVVMFGFQLVFYISLRDSAAQGYGQNNDDIEHMIENQLAIQSSKYDLSDILKTQRCLIIIDGLDEWSPQVKRASTRLASKDLPQIPLFFCGTVMTTSRLWKMETLRAELVGRVDKQVNIVGLDGKSIGKLVEKVLAILNERFEQNEFTRQFFDAVHTMDNDLRFMIMTPILLTHLVCLWFDDGCLANSLCELYEGMIIRQLKVTEKEKKLPTLPEHLIQHDQAWMPQCFSDHDVCRKYAKLLVSLRELAFTAFLSERWETALVFDHNQTEIHGMSGPEVEMCLRIGLLVQNKVVIKVTKDHKQVSFMHKTLQEYFAATYIVAQVLNGSNVKDLFETKPVALDLMLEMEKVFVFVCGLDGGVGEKLLTFVIQQISTDSRLQAYRTSMEKEREKSFETVIRIQNIILDCCKEAVVNKHSILLPIKDMAINSDWDPDILTRIIQNWNHLDTRQMASFCFVIPSASQTPPEITENHLRRILDGLLNTNCLQRILIFDWSDHVDVDAIYEAVIRSSETLKSLAFLNIPLSSLGDRLYTMIESLRLEAFGLEGYGYGYGNHLTQQQLSYLFEALSINPDLKRIRIEETFCDQSREMQFDLKLSDFIQLEELYLDNLFIGEIRLDVTELVVCEIRHFQSKGLQSTDSCRRLIARLKDATKLQQLVVRGFNEPEDIEILFGVLPYLTSLKRFVIGDVKFPNAIIGENLSCLTIPENLTDLNELEIRSFAFTNSALKTFVDSIPSVNVRTRFKKLDVKTDPDSEEEEDTFEYMRNSERFSIFRDDYKWKQADDTYTSWEGMWMCFIKKYVQ